jgi:hypothetical protein
MKYRMFLPLAAAGVLLAACDADVTHSERASARDASARLDGAAPQDTTTRTASGYFGSGNRSDTTAVVEP